MRPGLRVSQLLNVAFDMAAWVFRFLFTFHLNVRFESFFFRKS